LAIHPIIGFNKHEARLREDNQEARMEVSQIGISILRLFAFVIGLIVVISTVSAAIKIFVLPRAVNVMLAAVVFMTIGIIFRWRARKTNSYHEQDRVMAMYAPLALFVLSVVVLTLVLLGYTLIYWAVDALPLYDALRLSGSSLLTLGYASVEGTASQIVQFSEAMLGLILVALLIAYLPSMYAAFARREANVTLLEVLAGSPPSPVEMITRAYRNGELEKLREVWISWQTWFAELEESHTSLSALAFFRSPRPEHSWITAAGVILDTAALMISTVDVPWEPRAAFCIRSGYLALRQIASFFYIEYDPEPQRDDPISIERHEYDEICQRLEEQGVPLKEDLNHAWHDFSGWRVNYDVVLIALANMVMAPYALWSSDRSISPTIGEAGRLETRN
jgi:hypothetical protein